MFCHDSITFPSSCCCFFASKQWDPVAEFKSVSLSVFDELFDIRHIWKRTWNISTALSMESRMNIIYSHSGWRTVWLIRSYNSYISTIYIYNNSIQCSIWWFMISVFCFDFWQFFFFSLRSPFACSVVAVIVKVICLLFHLMTTTFPIIFYYIVAWTFQFRFKFLDQIPLIDVILRFWRSFNLHFNGFWLWRLSATVL